ncbi:MAG: PPC domain-containing protein [Chloroflexota bacterium]
MLVGMSFAVFAQNNTELTYGEPVTGQIDNQTYEQIYTFEGNAGDTIIITMTATDDAPERLDSYLVLRDQDGIDLSFDDDSAMNLNSRIGPFTLPEDGTYTIVATRFQQANGGSTGGYMLEITEANFDALVADSTQSGTLSAQNPLAYYTFTSEEDAIYELTTVFASGNGSIGVEVRSPSGQYITSTGADDFSRSNFALVNATAGEQMTVMVTHYVNEMAGADPAAAEIGYEITFNRVNSEALTLDAQGNIGITGELDSDTQNAYFTFEANVGETINITLANDPQTAIAVDIYGPEGYNQFHGDTAYQNNTNGTVLIPEMVVRTEGTYILAVNRTNLPPESRSLDPVNFALDLTVASINTLEAGVMIEDTLQPAMQFYQNTYTYDGQAGETITITLDSTQSSEAVGFSMEYAPQAQSMEYQGFNMNFHASEASTVTMTVTLPLDATYLIYVNASGYSPQTETITYTLLIESDN